MTFIFSSFTGLPDRYFSGYAFSGHDFISGSKGEEAFGKATGRRITGGLDGCYVAIWKEASKHRVGVDFNGYKKIFYYFDGSVWGVSNSIVCLADHLRENGIDLKADTVQLRGLDVIDRYPLAEQMTAFQTIVEGIALLPLACDLEIDGKQARVIRREGRSEGDYREALRDFLECWVGRMETLILDPRLRISCDLTGGKDSRLVFGLLMKARQRLGMSDTDVCRFNSNIAGGMEENDFAAAKGIADHYGVRLNLPRPAAGFRQWRSDEFRYRSWRDMNLGIYYPVYFPGAEFSSFRIRLGGGGGEGHRAFYRYKDFGDFARKLASDRTDDPILTYWVANIGETLRQLRSKSPGIDEWILHFREFRGRLHAGRGSQYFSWLAPLAGQGMDRLSGFPGKADNAQAHFDVMASLFPELPHLPYNHPSKGPNAMALANLTTVAPDARPAPGVAYIEPEDVEMPGNAGGETPLKMLLDDFERADKAEIGKLMPNVMAAAEREKVRAIAREDLGTGSNVSNIARAISAAYALSLG